MAITKSMSELKRMFCFTKSFVLKTAGEINSERNCAWLVYIQLVTKNHPIATILLKNNYFYVEAKDIS